MRLLAPYAGSGGSSNDPVVERARDICVALAAWRSSRLWATLPPIPVHAPCIVAPVASAAPGGAFCTGSLEFPADGPDAFGGAILAVEPASEYAHLKAFLADGLTFWFRVAATDRLGIVRLAPPTGAGTDDAGTVSRLSWLGSAEARTFSKYNAPIATAGWSPWITRMSAEKTVEFIDPGSDLNVSLRTFSFDLPADLAIPPLINGFRMLLMLLDGSIRFYSIPQLQSPLKSDRSSTSDTKAPTLACELLWQTFVPSAVIDGHNFSPWSTPDRIIISDTTVALTCWDEPPAPPIRRERKLGTGFTVAVLDATPEGSGALRHLLPVPWVLDSGGRRRNDGRRSDLAYGLDGVGPSLALTRDAVLVRMQSGLGGRHHIMVFERLNGVCVADMPDICAIPTEQEHRVTPRDDQAAHSGPSTEGVVVQPRLIPFGIPSRFTMSPDGASVLSLHHWLPSAANQLVVATTWVFPRPVRVVVTASAGAAAAPASVTPGGEVLRGYAGDARVLDSRGSAEVSETRVAVTGLRGEIHLIPESPYMCFWVACQLASGGVRLHLFSFE
ncbi:hypothetical protein HK405_009169 [Cladochytrium tenue]|nr:hypothetical protein HK405_009169 [Cladochytrium tenue]